MATIEKRGAVWRARVRRSGQDHTATFDTETEAREWAAAIEKKMAGGTHFQQLAAESISLSDALTRYQRDVLPLKKSGDREKYRVTRWQQHPLGIRPLASLRGYDFASYRDERLHEGASPSTVRLELALVSHLYTVCAREWGMEGLNNPVSAMKLPKPAKGRERRLASGEETRLLVAAASVHPLLPHVITVALDTAMRRGEMASLQWEDVNLDGKTALLRDPKNGETRSAPLAPRTLSTLASLWEPDGAVFPMAANNNAEAITRAFSKACRLAGIEGLRFHDLRHEATSRLVESGRFSLVEIASITGHKDMQMLKRYTHLNARQLAEKMG